jgi:glycosyltransferase involved in cell wall biosynthesis
MYVFNYSTYYPLVEAIRLAHQGVLVFDYHGVTPPQLWDGHGAETLEEGQRRLDLVRYADYAIAHSGFTRDELLRTGAIAPERVYQTAYVVPLDRFHPGSRPAELVERYQLDADQPVLLYVGRMAANKQISDLVRALALVCERFPRAVLMLVGDDRSAAYAHVASQARSLARDLGVAERVIFTGQVPDAELVMHYQLADLFVTASLHEGFCIPAIEAQACGKPVVGAHATALPETIGPGGLTFRPRDPTDLARKLLELLEHRCNIQ